MRQGEERDQEGDGGQEGAPHGAAHCSVLTVSYSQLELFYLDLHILSVTCEHWDLLRSWETLEIVRPKFVTFHLNKILSFSNKESDPNICALEISLNI